MMETVVKFALGIAVGLAVVFISSFAVMLIMNDIFPLMSFGDFFKWVLSGTIVTSAGYQIATLDKT